MKWTSYPLKLRASSHQFQLDSNLFADANSFTFSSKSSSIMNDQSLSSLYFLFNLRDSTLFVLSLTSKLGHRSFCSFLLKNICLKPSQVTSVSQVPHRAVEEGGFIKSLALSSSIIDPEKQASIPLSPSLFSFKTLRLWQSSASFGSPIPSKHWLKSLHSTWD